MSCMFFLKTGHHYICFCLCVLALLTYQNGRNRIFPIRKKGFLLGVEFTVKTPENFVVLSVYVSFVYYVHRRLICLSFAKSQASWVKSLVFMEIFKKVVCIFCARCLLLTAGL